jgi:hypothetical protein
MVVSNNLQGVGLRGDPTTILNANCRGVGPSQKKGHTRLYNMFQCSIRFRDENTGEIWTPAILRARGGAPTARYCSSKTSSNRILPYGLGFPGCP